jgi:hypothetical protein
MSSNTEHEFRIFENERLSFDIQKALLTTNEMEFQLEAVLPEVKLNANLQSAIVEFPEMC